MTQEQRCASAQGDYRHKGLVDVDPADERSIQPQEVQREADEGIGHEIREKDVAVLQSVSVTAGEPKEKEHVGEIQN